MCIAKSSLFSIFLTLPITNGELNVGRWNGTYLGEIGTMEVAEK